jgi:transposase
MSISELELNNHLTVLKEIYPWLKEVNSQSLQQASKNLNSSFNHFFKENAGFPKKKSKKNPIQSFQIKGMMSNHHRVQSTGDSAWYSFVLKLQYKAEWFGKTILKIGQWEPSSKTCNICGYKHPNLTENVREWKCTECKTINDRDINAAFNIKKFALMGHEEELVDSLAEVRGMKQEVSPSRA